MRLQTTEATCARSRSMSKLLRVALFASLVAFSLPRSARAEIVWEGRVVGAWPDLDGPRGASHDAEDGASELLLQQQARRGFYPSPKGVVWGLTILVDFSDQAPAFDKTQVSAWLNQKGYAVGGLNGSIRDYCLDNSNGQVDFQNDVVGFYRAARPKSNYEGGSGYQRSDELFREVIAALDAQVDFSKYDNDGDGRTDAISIVYAGEGVKWGQGLWPHASGSSARRDGVVLARYMLSALSRRLAIYTFAHESGHMLFGWPDLYGFGDYCVMGNATNPQNPAGINDFFRADQGWIPRVDITASTRASFTAASNGAGYFYTNPADAGELYFWSNIQNTGRWRVLRGSGLLFFHFNRRNRVNNPPNPLVLSVVQADGLEQLGLTQWPRPGSDPRDFFFAGGVTELSDATSPSARWANGSPSGLRVYGVDPTGREIRFSVGATGPAQPANVARVAAGRSGEDALAVDAEASEP